MQPGKTRVTLFEEIRVAVAFVLSPYGALIHTRFLEPHGFSVRYLQDTLLYAVVLFLKFHTLPKCCENAICEVPVPKTMADHSDLVPARLFVFLQEGFAE